MAQDKGEICWVPTCKINAHLNPKAINFDEDKDDDSYH